MPEELKMQKILVIDDSNQILMLLSEMLSIEGFEIITCLSAIEALKIIDDSIDLILLDLMMPEMNGKEFLSIFRKRKGFRYLPIIIFTAKDKTPEEITELYNLGINDYINKPFIRQELIARIKVHIITKNLEDKLFESNRKLKKELFDNKKLLRISLEYASELEKNLITKNDNPALQQDNQNAQSPEYLQKQISDYKEKEEKLLIENKKYMKKIEDLNNIFSTIVMHDTMIEDELSAKLDEATITSITDSLTKIFNRNKMNDSLLRETTLSDQKKSDLAIIMLDIDHFKNVNDTYGHDTGDEVLIGITDAISNNLREESIFARWGGEEFLILLPMICLKSAVKIAERLRAKIETLHFNQVGRVTCSFGVTQYIPGEGVDFFLKRVDNCLYRAKDTGRNCVRFY
ncbi:MAG: hypothetical protein A2015_15765 [Spirochaetes bacterium GWF1_31_7]|nr:MAG: hypothetical protein A2Y30_10900 [Spirochaetes bacterium GWE1_32_154]OHD48259.1 MAG: hypothetical protein A2Y29_00535 [Spirochaetes bacterium GWE2_31_10]OHD50662.1 MAG: hypothetical protein A2015_15765 [Spirochaetes bacterium GWF1_31_7]HBD96489.1 hypothetical protein [Spirochaetia bacterium]HBI37710.1 hypothetical protein [Spirochaetia bacterium]